MAGQKIPRDIMETETVADFTVLEITKLPVGVYICYKMVCYLQSKRDLDKVSFDTFTAPLNEIFPVSSRISLSGIDSVAEALERQGETFSNLKEI